MTLPKAIFFDWDGTLVDSFGFLEAGHHHVLAALGLARDRFDFKRYFGKPRDFIYQDVYGDQRVEAERLFSAYVAQNHATALSPMNGAQALLSALDVPMGIVTNKRGDFVRAEIKAFGWDDHFIGVVGAGEAAEDKPSPAPLAMAASAFAPEDIWYVGDSEADLGCAQAFGCSVIFVHPDPESQGYLSDYSPLKIVADCMALRDFVLQMAENQVKQA